MHAVAQQILNYGAYSSTGTGKSVIGANNRLTFVVENKFQVDLF